MPGPGFFRPLGLYVAENFLDLALCERLQLEMGMATGRIGTIIQDGQEGFIDETKRKVVCASLSKATKSLVKDRLCVLKPKLEEHFQVQLVGFESPDFLTYGEGGFYTPHRDASPESIAYVQRRRVSVVV